MADDDLINELRAAQPAWKADGKGLRGDNPRAADPHAPALHLPRATVERGQVQPPFPDRVPEEVTEETAGTAVRISFLLSNASTTIDDAVVHRVKIEDGKINGTFPDGMGGGDYILTPSDPNDGIVVAGITFDVTTLEITSRFLNLVTAGDYPENEIDAEEGTIYWQLGFMWMDGETFTVLSTRPGDINVAFAFGSNNGKPGLLPIESSPGWMNLDSWFEEGP